MTALGVRVFTAGSVVFGALWGVLTTGTLTGVVLGAAVAGFVGWCIWSSMRMREIP